MKIDHVRLYSVSMPLKEVFITSSEVIDARECIIVEVQSEGLTGYGECVAAKDPGYSYETIPTAWHILKDFLIPAVLGKDLPCADGFDERVSFVRGHPMAKAGLEMALWDLRGKAEGKSLKELFGGVREKVDVGVSIGIQPDINTLLAKVDGYLAKGYGRVKIKIKPGRETAETRAVRQAHPGLKLQVDANSAYTLENAAVLDTLDDLDLLLIEQPLSDDDLWDHRAVQARLKTPICLDESILSARHARQAIEMNACRVINIKAGRVGGLGVGMAIHDVCQKHGIPVWCGGMLETGVGRAANLALASLPGFTLPGDISATERYYAQDITEEVFTLNPNSTINVPQGAGLGVTMDKAALARFTREVYNI